MSGGPEQDAQAEIMWSQRLRETLHRIPLDPPLDTYDDYDDYGDDQ